jgi:Carboxypeptidase regulatory-like domain
MNWTGSKRQMNCGIGLRNTLLAGCLLMWLLAAGKTAEAQITTAGTINGTVVDQTGAVVPGARVTIVETETQTVTQTDSNNDGDFVQVGLDSGHYDVTIAATGFATFHETGIYLEPMAAFTVRAIMKPTSVASTVTVTGSEAQVQTVTAEVSSTVSGEEAQELPLNGRNFEQLGSLMPGVINSSPVATMGTGGYSTTNTLIINGGTLTNPSGSGETGAIYYLDGLWISSNVVHDENIVTPNPDEITEVKAMQNNYSAQYTLMGASTVVVETKSGSETFHGGAWEFLRNTALNATQYFSHTPTAMNWDIFGYNLGGPLHIPKLYDAGKKRTFFYFNQQWVRQKAGSQATGQAPLATMRGQGTPNGELLFPGTSASPVAGIGGPYGIAFLTDPSLPAGHCSSKTNDSSCFTQDASGNWIIPAGRVDQNALTLLNTLVPLPNDLTGGVYSASSAAADYLNTSPNITDQVDLLGKVDHNLTSRLRLTGEYMVEEQTFTGANAARYGTAWPTNYDVFATDDQAFQARLTQILSPTMTNQTSASIGIFDGNHDFGGIRLLSQVPGFHQTLPYSGAALMNYVPSTSFSQGWTKFGTGSSYIVPRATELHDTITDDWSWTHGKHFLQAGFTMFFGTERHWSWPSTPQGFWTFSGYATSNAMPDYLLGMASAFSQGNNGVRTYAHYKIASPYVEETWKATRRLTLSGGLRYSWMPWPTEQTGYMVDFNPALFNAAQAPAITQTGVITSAPSAYNQTNGLVLNGMNGIPLNLSNARVNYWGPVGGFALDLFGDGKTSLRGGYGLTYYATAGEGCDEGGCVGYPTLLAVNLGPSNFDDPAGAATPSTVPNEAGENLANFSASKIHTYSLSIEQQFGGSWIMSIAGAGSMQRAGANSININQAAPTTVNGVAYDFNPNLNSASYSNAYYAPYQGYGTITYYENIGLANWNALEASLRHRTTKNLYLTAAYTWSHGMDNYGGFQNVRNLATAYGNSGNDIPQVFTASAIYYLPRLDHSELWMRELLGGWQASDMTTIQSGGTGTLSLSTSNNGLATRPNQTGPISYPENWRTAGGTWFSTAPFAKPANGYFGNAGTGTIRDPGTEDYNMALYKTFTFTERVKMQFRAEFFNVFNHTNPNAPGMGFGSAAFGEISGEKEAREGEGSLKITF